MKRKIVYVDMDGVLCDYEKGITKPVITPITDNETLYPQSMIGFFSTLDPIPGAISAVSLLSNKYDIWILSKPSCLSIHSYTEKAIWIRRYLGYKMQERLILCTDKSLLKGDYLIDDMVGAGQENFEGEFIQFGSFGYLTWSSVVEYLLDKD